MLRVDLSSPRPATASSAWPPPLSVLEPAPRPLLFCLFRCEPGAAASLPRVASARPPPRAEPVGEQLRSSQLCAGCVPCRRGGGDPWRGGARGGARRGGPGPAGRQSSGDAAAADRPEVEGSTRCPKTQVEVARR
ncbi:unnamed protein product [Prorocentrum cordatum]|uniref:Uncharacterized protein n=1 Tax=Prorocentrum cordatum TaxID=2364126 RepID=A0ABN9R4J3_9DINO|nr:unnamed protein product [Polarella glacialis]